MLQQRTLNNARILWQRFVDRTRNDVVRMQQRLFLIDYTFCMHRSTATVPWQEERVEQLRSFSFLSGIVAGFAVASLLQLSFDPLRVPQGIQIWFAVSTGATVRPLLVAAKNDAMQL